MTAWTKKRRLMRRYDLSAKVYDNQYREEQEAKIKATMDSIAVASERIIDVGCGTGLLFEHVATKAQFMVGTDISRGIVAEARRKTRTYQSAALIQSDSDNLPFRDGTFDIVFAITVVQNVPNPEITLNEIWRVSKSNAKIIVTGLKKSFTQNEFIRLLGDANLRVESVRSDDLKDYVCICVKAPVKSKSCTQQVNNLRKNDE